MISLDSSPDGPVPFVFLSPMPIMMKMDLVGCGEPNLACEGLGEAAGSGQPSLYQFVGTFLLSDGLCSLGIEKMIE